MIDSSFLFWLFAGSILLYAISDLTEVREVLVLPGIRIDRFRYSEGKICGQPEEFLMEAVNVNG